MNENLVIDEKITRIDAIRLHAGYLGTEMYVVHPAGGAGVVGNLEKFSMSNPSQDGETAESGVVKIVLSGVKMQLKKDHRIALLGGGKIDYVN